MTDNKNNKEASLICNIYAAMVVVLSIMFVPIKEIMAVSFILLILLPISLYVIRGRYEAGSLVENHMSYLIKTFWVGGLFLTIGFIIACIWFWNIGDHSQLFTFLDNHMYGQYGTDITAVIMAYEQMMIEYMNDNISNLIFISVISLIPGVAYIIYRVAKGLTKAIKGYRIGNDKGWF